MQQHGHGTRIPLQALVRQDTANITRVIAAHTSKCGVAPCVVRRCPGDARYDDLWPVEQEQGEGCSVSMETQNHLAGQSNGDADCCAP